MLWSMFSSEAIGEEIAIRIVVPCVLMDWTTPRDLIIPENINAD
jgi:hypothetical protein